MAKKWKLQCAHVKTDIESYRRALTEMECFTLFEAIELIDFYLERSLADSCKLGGTLATHGWSGSAKLGKLEKLIKEAIGIENDRFLIARTGSFPKTLNRFGFEKNKPICVDCPRVAITIEFEVSEGIVKPKKRKTRVGCFLRHIRNAIAHGNTFGFPNGNVLFIDYSPTNATSGFILLPATALIEIMQLIVAGPSENEKS